MVKLAAEIVCLWKASSVFPSGKKYQGAGVRLGTGAFCISGSNTNMSVSSHTLLMREMASAVQLCDVPDSLEGSFTAPSSAGRPAEVVVGLGLMSSAAVVGGSWLSHIQPSPVSHSLCE